MPRTEAELNEYLAKAVGITDIEPLGPGWSTVVGKYPDGVRRELPFTYDLQFCVKWLGPLFHYWEVATVTDGFRAQIGTGKGLFSNIEATPALAFCRAAEQALDAGARP